MTHDPQRILIVLPSWVGDAVMATPALAAMRDRFPAAHISLLLRRNLKPLFTAQPWADRVLSFRHGKRDANLFRLAKRLRRGRFDLAILLPNSFRAAVLAKLAKIPRIVGYDRDGRGVLLTDRLIPYRERGRFVPSPIVDTYLGIARYLGTGATRPPMKLFVGDTERADAAALLQRIGLPTDIDRPTRAGGAPLVMLNPGAQYGAAKCWLPEYFAALGDRLATELNATVLISSAPKERAIVDKILSHAKRPMLDLAAAGMSLGTLKEIIRRCDLMVTNDTGPRHLAAALGTPVVTLFGPTDPRWTLIDFPLERQLSVPVFCGPCQRKKCPLDHRCMTRLTPPMVFDACRELLAVSSRTEISAAATTP